MTMAFLPTAILYLLSVTVIIGVFVLFLLTMSTPTLAILLLIIAVACYVLAYIGAYKLYDNVMLLAPTDFYQWYPAALRIARRCHGLTKTIVLLEIAEQMLLYEKPYEAEKILLQLRRRIIKSGSAKLRFRYLMILLRVRELEGDTKNRRLLLEQIYHCLNVRSDWSKADLKTSRRQFDTALLRMRFYAKDSHALMTTDRNLTIAWHSDSQRRFQENSRTEDESDYFLLSDSYNLGLTYLLLGNEAEAVRYYRVVADAPFHYPLQERMKQYLCTVDPSVLLQTIT